MKLRQKGESLGKVDVYPVGFLIDLQRLVHSPEPVSARLGRFRRDLRYPMQRARERNWRSVKSYLNGYLAEPSMWPDGLRRCGTGWTRGRAYRDLIRRASESSRDAQ